jgi:hypothetical protein
MPREDDNCIVRSIAGFADPVALARSRSARPALLQRSCG